MTPHPRSWLSFLYPYRKNGPSIYVMTPDGEKEISRLAASQVLQAWAEAVGGSHVTDVQHEKD